MRYFGFPPRRWSPAPVPAAVWTHGSPNRGVTFLPNYPVHTSSTVIPFVEQGLAIGILPSLFAQNLPVQEGFSALDTEPIPTRQILLVHRGEGRAFLLCQEFIRLLQG